jgi:hypothetical protein
MAAFLAFAAEGAGHGEYGKGFAESKITSTGRAFFTLAKGGPTLGRMSRNTV